MDTKQYNTLFSFIWNIANDVLVHAFEKGDLRKYIIENDLLEAIIAMPENDFYNTGIATYIWIITNRKEERRHILKLHTDFRETPESKIFPNQEFGYWQVPVLRPKRDDDGNIILKKGVPIMAKSRNEVEQIPLLYPGGIEAFYEKEVKPYDAEAQFGTPIIGYELSFTKYFYKPVELRPLTAIMEDIRSIEKDTDGLLDEIMK